MKHKEWGRQEDEEIVMTGVSEETYEKMVDMFSGSKVTNFDRITESPEALAEFIKTIVDVCYTCDRDEYPQCTICWCNPIAVKNWLMAEVEE